MNLLVFYVTVTLTVSFLCSLLEAALLSVRGFQLAARKQAGDQGAAALLDIKENRLDDAISSVLTLNTLAHTIGAGLAGAQAEELFGHVWVGVFLFALTIAVLMLTEIVPKTIGAAYADRLVGFVARTLLLLMTLLKPALVLTKFLTDKLARDEKTPISRGDVQAVVTMAGLAGTIKDHESLVLDNILGLEQIHVEDVMTPRTVVKMLPVGATLADFLADHEATAFSRIPLYRASRDHIEGYVLNRELLTAALKGDDRSSPLLRYRRKVRYVPENATLSQALENFLGRREALTMVVDEYGGVSGLITLEDVMETVLGHEIVDELDTVADLRTAATRLRDRRLKRLMEETGIFQGPAES